MSVMTNTIVVGYSCNGALLRRKPCPRSQDLFWNPIFKLGVSKFKNIDVGLSERRQQLGNGTKRSSFVVYAETGPAGPLPSTPPPSGSLKSWILGILLSVILPLFSGKGPLWVLKNKIETTVQTVEDIAETVEKVAEAVDKIAEELGDDLPEGNLKRLASLVEDVAEKTAKSADSLDDLIDKVQEAEDQMESVVETLQKEAAAASPKGGIKK